MREFRSYGSVRGVPGDRHSYRDEACFSFRVAEISIVTQSGIACFGGA